MLNSTFARRIRASQQHSDDENEQKPLDQALDPPASDEEEPARKPRKCSDSRDRFIPSQDTGDMRTSFNMIGKYPKAKRPSPGSNIQTQTANALFKTVLHTETRSPSKRKALNRVFRYSLPAISSDPQLGSPSHPAYALNSSLSNDSSELLRKPRPPSRSIANSPYRVVDAPGLEPNWYLNLVDWSSSNIVGVGLESAIYYTTMTVLSPLTSTNVSMLCDLFPDTISSLSWMPQSSYVATGTLGGQLRIYDSTTNLLLRAYNHRAPRELPESSSRRIAVLSWNGSVISSGHRDGSIQHRDIREPTTKRPSKRSVGHKREVCGLKWSLDGSKIASGGNDNNVCIWDARGSGRRKNDEDVPLWKFRDHLAAVKGIAWSPHEAGVLATGGGNRDERIRFWNILHGTKIAQINTRSQVCNLAWSPNSLELVSTHGFSLKTAPNQIMVWKYPTLDMVVSLTGHTKGVLHLGLSPSGENIVTGSGDETLRFWNVFPGQPVESFGHDRSPLKSGSSIR
ncbi:WD40-repeat-containing domain protein [Mycena floridula]|nr:WD40-repeat-containing domain protein [Mycena floridula]